MALGRAHTSAETQRSSWIQSSLITTGAFLQLSQLHIGGGWRFLSMLLCVLYWKKPTLPRWKQILIHYIQIFGRNCVTFLNSIWLVSVFQTKIISVAGRFLGGQCGPKGQRSELGQDGCSFNIQDWHWRSSGVARWPTDQTVVVLGSLIRGVNVWYIFIWMRFK